MAVGGRVPEAEIDGRPGRAVDLRELRIGDVGIGLRRGDDGQSNRAARSTKKNHDNPFGRVPIAAALVLDA